jgi:hypothetical protein
MARPTALDLFRIGHDTVEIARILKITEAKALEQISQQRSAMLGLPSPYAPKADVGSSKPVRLPVGKRKLSRPPIGLRCGV